MCGIAGICSIHGIDPATLQRMSAALRHRGPDGFGYLLASPAENPRLYLNQEPPGEDGPVTLGLAHRRLAIIDLSAASLQPMCDEAGEVALVFNGEIYNYPALRTELEGLGYTFQTSGDTEVLLRAYQAWGPDCARRLNGMWAFAVLDRRRNCLLLCRDRFGIKPLYYAVHQGALYFASEIKGLLAAGIPAQPNERTVARFLLQQADDTTDETFYEGIYRFPAAQQAVIPLDAREPVVHPQPYWTFPTEAFRGSEQQAIAQFRDLFFDAVKIHNQSDVPVGTCLSGGLDSSALVCVSEQLRARGDVPSYSHAAFGYCSSDARYNERRFMDAVVGVTGADMHYIEITQQDFEESLPAILAAQDEPFGSASIVAQWFVFKRARETGIIVMLDGQGADETLAGYHAYLAPYAATLLSRGNLAGYQQLKAACMRELGIFPVSRMAIARMLIPTPLQGAYRALKQLAGRQKRHPLLPASVSAAIHPALVTAWAADAEDAYAPRTLSQALQHSVRSSILPGLLRYEDRNSMCHSLESRVPFLDYRLVDLLFTLPDAWKIQGLDTKHILREALRGILPEVIRTRHDKIGFRPEAALTLRYAHDHAAELARNSSELEQRWFAEAGLQALFNSPDNAQVEYPLWRLINVKLWARKHWGE
ncbi:MAG TPA: asparagine synthase (glutamine-hydrolyzing) [Armatimonadota bacterium]|jgi:asparagine synthase (glutamine-hydrolysing)